MPTENGSEKPRNPLDHFGSKRGPRFGKDKPVKAGPGRPPIPPEIKDALKETREILKNLSPLAALRLGQLAQSPFGNIAVAASRAILEKTVPTLEEVTNHDRPLQPATDEQLKVALDNIRSSRNGHTPGNGVTA